MLTQTVRGLMATIMLAAVLAGAPAPAGRAQAQTSLSEPGTYVVELESGQTMRVGENALAAWSPDGTLLALAELIGEPAETRLRLLQLSDGTMTAVPLLEPGEVNLLRWSPDGARLALTVTRLGPDPGPGLVVVDPATAVARQLVRGSVGEIAWTPDSSAITAITLDDAGGAIVTFDAATGEVRDTILELKDAGCQRGLAWSPDGRFLALAGPGLHEGCGDVGNWGVWSWEQATRTARHVFRGAADVPHWLTSGEIVAMVSEPREEGLPPLSLLRFAPTRDESHAIARDIPRMSPLPPRLVQVADGSVLFPISTCERAEAHIWIPDQASVTWRTPAGVYAYRPALAPDGRSLAYVQVGEANALTILPLDGGAARVPVSSTAGLQVGTAGPWDAGGDWSPDGRWLVIEVTSEQLRDCLE